MCHKFYFSCIHYWYCANHGDDCNWEYCNSVFSIVLKLTLIVLWHVAPTIVLISIFIVVNALQTWLSTMQAISVNWDVKTVQIPSDNCRADCWIISNIILRHLTQTLIMWIYLKILINNKLISIWYITFGGTPSSWQYIYIYICKYYILYL